MMRVPGCDVLEIAFSAISKTTLLYYKAVGRSLSTVGQYITTYAAATFIQGSFQPVEKNKYNLLGLDLQKAYFYLYIPKNLVDLERDVSADQFSYQGKLYQVQSSTEWFGIDGWLEILTVYVGPDLAAQNVFGFNDPSLLNGNQNFYDGNFNPIVERPPHGG